MILNLESGILRHESRSMKTRSYRMEVKHSAEDM
jgi:hypothetical protein